MLSFLPPEITAAGTNILPRTTTNISSGSRWEAAAFVLATGRNARASPEARWGRDHRGGRKPGSGCERRNHRQGRANREGLRPTLLREFSNRRPAIAKYKAKHSSASARCRLG